MIPIVAAMVAGSAASILVVLTVDSWLAFYAALPSERQPAAFKVLGYAAFFGLVLIQAVYWLGQALMPVPR